MNNCGKCVHFGHFWWGFGKCFGGTKYAAGMAKKGRAPTRCFCSPACACFEHCETVGIVPIGLRDAVELSIISRRIHKEPIP